MAVEVVVKKIERTMEFPKLMINISNGSIVFFEKFGFGIPVLGGNVGFMYSETMHEYVDFNGEVVLNSSQTEDYPVLKESANSGVIVYFVNKQIGVVVKRGNNDVNTTGHCSGDWAAWAFEKSDVEVTLSNIVTINHT